MSASTSPTLKRKRIIQEAILPETESMEIEEDCLNDLSTSFEDMEIADSEDDLSISRSKLIDEKVIEKQRRNYEKEDKFRNKVKEVLLKKNKIEEKKSKQLKAANKKQKQKNKDDKKKSKPKAKVTGNTLDGKPKYRIPNVRDIPKNCKHLENIDDVLYVVPGDGCCGPNCGAHFCSMMKFMGQG